MQDKVAIVREESLNSLKLIANFLEKSWMENQLLEIIEPFLLEKDHTLRLKYFLFVQVASFDSRKYQRTSQSTS